MLIVTHAPFVFGYAKPVPVNFLNLRNPKRDMIWVAAAGPAMNLALAFVCTVIWKSLAPMLDARPDSAAGSAAARAATFPPLTTTTGRLLTVGGAATPTASACASAVRLHRKAASRR